MNDCCQKWLTKDIVYEEIEQSNVERRIRLVVVEVKYCPSCGNKIERE